MEFFLEYNTHIINVNIWGAYLPKIGDVTKELQKYSSIQGNYGLKKKDEAEGVQKLKYGIGFFLGY